MLYMLNEAVFVCALDLLIFHFDGFPVMFRTKYLAEIPCGGWYWQYYQCFFENGPNLDKNILHSSVLRRIYTAYVTEGLIWSPCCCCLYTVTGNAAELWHCSSHFI